MYPKILDLRTFDPKIFNLKTLDLKTLDRKTLDCKTLDFRTLDPKTLDSRTVLPKLGCRGPLNRTKSGTKVFTKCILSNFSQEKSLKAT